MITTPFALVAVTTSPFPIVSTTVLLPLPVGSAMVLVTPSGLTTTTPLGPILIVVPSMVTGASPGCSVVPGATTIPPGPAMSVSPPAVMVICPAAPVGIGIVCVPLGPMMMMPVGAALNVVSEMTTAGSPGRMVIPGATTPEGSAVNVEPPAVMVTPFQPPLGKGMFCVPLGSTMTMPVGAALTVVPDMTSGGLPGRRVVPGATTTPDGPAVKVDPPAVMVTPLGPLPGKGIVCVPLGLTMTMPVGAALMVVSDMTRGGSPGRTVVPGNDATGRVSYYRASGSIGDGDRSRIIVGRVV